MSKGHKKEENEKFGPPVDHKLVAYIAPTGIVTEGSMVELDGTKSYVEYLDSADNNNENRDRKMRVSATATRPITSEYGISFSWQQIEGSQVTLLGRYGATASFTAPFLNLNNNPKIYSILKFQLTIKDGEGNSSKSRIAQVIVKMLQRALVLQGGGALGAYELGVFKALCEDLASMNEKSNRMLFDIIAGTSIGAVNASIVVGTLLSYKRDHPQANQTDIWKYSVQELEKFWSEISDPLTLLPKWIHENPFSSSWLNNLKIATELGELLFTSLWDHGRNSTEISIENYKSMIEIMQRQISHRWNWVWPYMPIFTEDWPYFRLVSWRENWREEWPYISGYFYWPENYGSLATSEAARRYYSYLASLFYGVPRVLLPGIAQPDMKFPSGLNATFTRFDNSPLARTVKKYWDFEKHPIKTSFDKLEPRLILVGVDMLDATTAVAFDSYPDQNDKCVTNYGDNEIKRIIEYPEGITIDHVVASMSTHLRYKYQKLEVKDGATEGKRESRLFWDGAYLSNTPLREVLHLHKYYWQNIKKETVEMDEVGSKISIAPDLEIYIVNLYPSIERKAPVDADAIQDREIDIKFHDKTKYDVKVAEMTTDYLELIEQLINIAYKHAEEDSEFKADLEKLLMEKTRSKKRSGERRTYKDILDGRADISKVVYVERNDDGNTIFGKAFEFSSKTIRELEKTGYDDARIAMRSGSSDG